MPRSKGGTPPTSQGPRRGRGMGMTTPPGPAAHPRFGRLNDPTVAAFFKGPCGDEIEFYLVIEQERIVDVRYYTEGCAHTRRCGAAVAERVIGRAIMDALGISAQEIIAACPALPSEGKHCAILAVSALYRAIALYLLMP